MLDVNTFDQLRIGLATADGIRNIAVEAILYQPESSGQLRPEEARLAAQAQTPRDSTRPITRCYGH